MPADPPAVCCFMAADKRCRIGAESFGAQQYAPYNPYYQYRRVKRTG